MRARQLSLDDDTWRPVQDVHGLARYGDPQTSVDAAQRISGRTERLIVEYMRGQARDWTSDELCVALPTIWPPTVKSAISRLRNHDLVEDTGQTRPSSRGLPSIVWRLK